MPSIDRSRAGTIGRLATFVAVVVLAGCQAAASSSTPVASVAVVVTPPPSVAASPTAAPSATARPTPRPLPTVLTRPTDIPTDGTCEAPRPCLGLIAAGSHHSQLFVPGFSFTMAAAGWENLAMSPGDVALLPLDAPGDEIAFFAHPRLTKPDGTLDLSAKTTADGIAGWFATNADLTVGPVTDVTIGGLHGKQLDLSVAPTSTAHQADCPVQTCVLLMSAQAATWAWDWSTISSERQRLDVLDSKDGVAVIFVDSLDGTTYDALIKRADAILATVKFDQ